MRSSTFTGMEEKKMLSHNYQFFQFISVLYSGAAIHNNIIKAFIAIIVFEAYQKGALNKYVHMSFSLTTEVREVDMNLNPLWQ